MKVLTKQEYIHAMDSGRLKLHMHDVVIDEYDIGHSYYKIVCVGNDVHLHPCDKPVSEVVDWEEKNKKEY